MSRSALSLLALLIASAFAPAITVSRPHLPFNQRSSILQTAKPFPEVLLPEPVAVKKDAELEVTRQTEVKVDGRPCRYEDVPVNVEAVLIEVAEDGKTIVKIHFRLRKR